MKTDAGTVPVRAINGDGDSPCACYWKIEADGRDINLHMVETGNAWHYSYYDKTPAYAAAEVAAREAKKGLWAAEGPINPYRWRKGDRTAAVRVSGREAPPLEPLSGGLLD